MPAKPVEVVDEEGLAERLAKNVKQLRESRSFTQQQIAKIAGVPRATWANLESGAANPTLAILHRVAVALQVSIEELISSPPSACRLYPKGSLPTRAPGLALVRKLLPDPIPGMEIDRLELAPNARMTGVPHTPGTREYLTCESGELLLVVSGERFTLGPGDVAVFRGDQRHSYANAGARTAVGYSVVVLARVE
ncbi:MAG TPA: XRE family transcriptional regulator [Minicystis sp.]|nr:XRE family transcriptional regulator [Minicystis sp.]